tara:strand:+ start:802 stop:1662 length:861 start_codon:yes stop_codon:yes gene_type:complete
MDLRHWFGGKQISSAFLALFDSLVIMIFIPVFDLFIYPLITKCRGGVPLSVLQKIGSGLIFTALSMGVAGLIEIERKASKVIPVSPECATNMTFDTSCENNSVCAPLGQIQKMHEISIWWESIQYTLIGIGEILTSISSYELFYSQVPESMRSVCQGLNLLTTSVGFMITGGINSVFSFWIPNDLDKGHLEYVYFIVAIMTMINLAAFLQVSQSFEYTNDVNVMVSSTNNSSSSSSKNNEDDDGSQNEEEQTVLHGSFSPNWTKHPSRSKWRLEQRKKERAQSMIY